MCYLNIDFFHRLTENLRIFLLLFPNEEANYIAHETGSGVIKLLTVLYIRKYLFQLKFSSFRDSTKN